jgi:hypothetical protein
LIATILRHAIAQVLILERREAHLHRRDWHERSRDLDLAHCHVAKAEVTHLAFIAQTCERADTRFDRRFRIDDVELIEGDRVHPECASTRLACIAKILGAPIGDPCAIGSAHATLRRDGDARAIATPPI